VGVAGSPRAWACRSRRRSCSRRGVSCDSGSCRARRLGGVRASGRRWFPSRARKVLSSLLRVTLTCAAQHCPQLGRAGGVGPAGQYPLDVVGGGVVAHAGLVAGAGQLICVQDGGQVDQRPGGGGTRDAAPQRRLAPVQAPALAAGRDLGVGRPALEEAQQLRRRAAAQHGPFTAGLYRRQIARLQARRLVPDPIDAAKDRNQGPRAQPLIDLTESDPRLQELASTHHPVPRVAKTAIRFSTVLP
jgi:hypothetical protein